MKSDSRYFEARHPIGVVFRRTGLKPDVLRAWERRYGAVTPGRSSGNRRIYSDADIEKLVFLRQAIQGGRRISQVARLNHQELEELVVADQTLSGLRTPEPAAGEPDSEHHVEACLVAVEQLDARDLETELQHAAVALSQPHLMEDVLVPLMEKIGELWSEGSLRVAHEHMACAVVRSFLAGMSGTFEVFEGAPELIVATPRRQFHEMGALVVVVTAASQGWGTTYLGTDLPADEIAAAARQKGARAVALSIVYPPDDSKLPEELRKLHRHLGESIFLLAGGRSASSYQAVSEEIGARSVRNVAELRAELQRLRK